MISPALWHVARGRSIAQSSAWISEIPSEKIDMFNLAPVEGQDNRSPLEIVDDTLLIFAPGARKIHQQIVGQRSLLLRPLHKRRDR